MTFREPREREDSSVIFHRRFYEPRFEDRRSLHGDHQEVSNANLSRIVDDILGEMDERSFCVIESESLSDVASYLVVL